MTRAASEMGWTGFSNGQSLDETEKSRFDAVVTGDQNFVFQQNLVRRTITVVGLSSNMGGYTGPAGEGYSGQSPTPQPEPSPSPCCAARAGHGRPRI
jgi:hypothetical protein